MKAKVKQSFEIPQGITYLDEIHIQEEIKMSQERYALNKQLAQMLKGGVIMDVTTPEQAKIA